MIASSYVFLDVGLTHRNTTQFVIFDTHNHTISKDERVKLVEWGHIYGEA